MSTGEHNNSGELSTFLHLTGWRPLVLALVAGLAGAFGLFTALNEPAQWQARYVINANRVAENDILPTELDLFAGEIAQTARFPQVIDEVEDITGLVEEDDYEISVNQSGATPNFIDVNVVSEDPEEAQTVAIETSIAALNFALGQIVEGEESARDRIQEEVDTLDAQVAELTAQAGGLNPAVAYQAAVNDLLQARNDPDNAAAPESVLERRVADLEPIEREFSQLQFDLDALNAQLASRSSSVRDARSALALIELERENPLIITEVVTEETSRIAALLTGLLLFAVPVALVMILLFVAFDALFRKPEPAASPAADFDPSGELSATQQLSLPEGKRSLTVVDQHDQGVYGDVLTPDGSHIDVESELVDSDELAEDEGDDDASENGKATKKSKDGRWGRNAGSKAG